MIEAKDLRIGNIVTDEFYQTFERTIVIDSICDLGVNIFPSDDGKPFGMQSPETAVNYEFKELFGIPLTEEILIKAGFNTLEDDEEIYQIPGNDLFQIAIEHDTNGIIFSHIFDGAYSGAKIDFLHKLQNLYYTLTNEELTINL